MIDIVLDLGGVLLNHNMPECIRRFKLILGDNYPRLGLTVSGEGTDLDLMHQYEAGMVTTDQFIARIMAWGRPGTTEDDVREAWLAMHDSIPPQRLEQVRRLRGLGYKLYLLSNNNEMHWQSTTQRYGLPDYFDKVFLSQTIHSCKPDKVIYETLIAETNVKFGNTVFVDDVAENRQTGESFGWKTFATLEALMEAIDAKQIV
ncbi:MAG: HAD family phosphatase [Bacteroidia bacterium]|nr:HAD family phosphatase [Bacteroidia bacterium]